MSTEMTSYEVVKYESPKNQVPSKVHRYPVYRRAARKALSPPSPPPPVPAPAPAPAPAPEWSQWERVEGSKWDGWWRARPQEDGGWFYQFTKDGSTIWQQKPVPSETPEPSTASANTAGEDVMFGEIAATALALDPATITTTITTTSTASNAMSYASGPAVAFTALGLPYEFSALTLRGNSEAYGQASPSTYAQEEEPVPTNATETSKQRQAASSPRQKRNHRHSPPSPPPPKVKTSITLSEEEEGKHIILDILNLEKPIVIRRISEQ
ncbi:hypothetical protein M406DRAFT_326175 [Cryphonectria parasitica EP155]|uniref:Uncharacterized protein n=1 Tax=Cryphonectria parasitica (strain ATCC 38755 / EP155) TaxID=660469 RepID=A0A9P5CUZ7_CRYP1|nr:uncharacterized protein M406DRAFT_326175 [Cryphonectria parasitica EP155]KAF3770751.1 hypothetical protein M406DRAFT_326175 [Cryphonectria parasitica EP155]